MSYAARKRPVLFITLASSNGLHAQATIEADVSLPCSYVCLCIAINHSSSCLSAFVFSPNHVPLTAQPRKIVPHASSLNATFHSPAYSARDRIPNCWTCTTRANWNITEEREDAVRSTMGWYAVHQRLK